jgi:hypothetical protein
LSSSTLSPPPLHIIQFGPALHRQDAGSRSLTITKQGVRHERTTTNEHWLFDSCDHEAPCQPNHSCDATLLHPRRDSPVLVAKIGRRAPFEPHGPAAQTSYFNTARSFDAGTSIPWVSNVERTRQPRLPQQSSQGRSSSAAMPPTGAVSSPRYRASERSGFVARHIVARPPHPFCRSLDPAPLDSLQTSLSPSSLSPTSSTREDK